MPICTACRDNDGVGDVDTCPVCEAGPVTLYPNGTVRFHKVDRLALTDEGSVFVGRKRCEGTGLPPVVKTGHDRCNGCPCQHKPRGSWNASNA